MKNLILKSDEITRHHFVKGLASGLLGLNFTSNLPAATSSLGPKAGKAKSVIFIRVLGGLSQVDSFDIKEDNKVAIKASEPMKSNADGIRVGKHFPGMSKHMDKFALVNSMHHTQGTHAQATYLLDTGYEARGTVSHPDLGAWTCKLGGKETGPIPSFIKIGESKDLGRGFFPSENSALPIKDPQKGIQYSKINEYSNQQTFDQRISLMNMLNKEFEAGLKNKITEDYNNVYTQALEMMKSKDLDVFDISQESKETKQAYGNNNFGFSCLLARRLAEKGIRFMSLTSRGWDHHYNIYEEIGEMAKPFDQGISALMADLSSRGLLESTLVVVSSEFGRGAVLGTKGGRGHNPTGYTSLLAGAGIHGGQQYGKTDEQGGIAIENKVGPADLNATVGYALGLPLDHIEFNETGRPFQIGNKHGKPITALF